MKTVNQILPAGRRSANKLLTESNETLQSSQVWDQTHADRIAQVWHWMTKTFGSKWDTQWGPMMTEDGKATPNYEEWYRETRQLSNKQWVYGFGRVERKITADIANDRDPWPPTTPAIFVAMCSPPKSEAVGEEGTAHKSFGKHPNLIARDKEERLAIEQPGRKERVNKAGNTALKDMLKDL